MRRWCSLVLGVGLVLSVLGVVPASASGKNKKPDLVVASASVAPARVAPGGRLTVRDTTRNKGRRVARRSTTRYLLSKDKKVDKRDVRLGQRPVKRLKPRQKHVSGKRKFRVPRSVKPGNYWLLVCADARKQVRESKERNNCRVVKARRLRIVRPPKKPDPPRPPGLPDGTLDVTARVQVEWRRWNQRNNEESVTDDDQRATFDLRTAGTLQVRGGQPMYLLLHLTSGQGRGTRAYRYQNGCHVSTGSLRAGWVGLDPATHPGTTFFVVYPHPVQTEPPGAMGSVRHTFTGGTTTTNSCGSVSEHPLDLRAHAGHDTSTPGTTVTSFTTSDRRVSYSYRTDIQDTETVKLGEEATVTIDLEIPD